MQESINDKHIQNVNVLFTRACKLLKMKNVTWRHMQGRNAPVNTAHDYNLGYTDLEKREITLDIYTPRRRSPKSANGILRVIAHELAHLQKPPYRQKFRGRMITRMHFPEFYDQVNANVESFKRDKEFRQYFRI